MPAITTVTPLTMHHHYHPSPMCHHHCRPLNHTPPPSRLVGTVLLLVEKEYFNDEMVAKAVRKACKEAKCKRTANEANLPGAAHQLKHAAVSSDRQVMNGSSHSHLVHPFISQLNNGVEGVANSSDEESDRDEGEMVGADALVQIPLEPAGSLEALLEVVIKEKSSEFNSTSSKR